MYFFVELDGGLVRTRLPEPPVRGIAHDREQPRAGIAAAEPVGILMRSQVRLLHVLRVFPAAHQPSRQVIGGIEMWQKEFGKPAILSADSWSLAHRHVLLRCVRDMFETLLLKSRMCARRGARAMASPS